MNLGLQLLIIAYEFGCLPLLFGLLLAGKKEQSSLSAVYMWGYVMELAIFWLIATPVIFIGKSLSDLTGYWSIISVVFLPILLLLLFLKRNKVKDIVIKIATDLVRLKNESGITIVVLILVMLFSIVFIAPSMQDETTEVVNIAVDTDAMYQYQPYTQIAYQGIAGNKAISPIEMLYAVAVRMTKMDAVILIHSMLPFFLIPFYYAVAMYTASYFYKDDLKKKCLFTIFVVFFYTAAWGASASPVIGMLQNSWNGISVFTGCIAPILFVYAFRLIEMLDGASRQNADGFLKNVIKIWKESDKGSFLKLILLIAASQLTMSYGIVLSVLILALAVGIDLVRKGMRYVRHA